MDRALFVAQYDNEDTRALLREAGELAAGVNAELIVLHVMDEEDYEAVAESRRELRSVDAELTQLGGYPLTEAAEDAERAAERIGWDVLEDLPLEWLAVGTVGRESREILDAAAEFDVDHLFVVGERRSPSGKAVFGDLAQQLLLEFSGPVTARIPDPE